MNQNFNGNVPLETIESCAQAITDEMQNIFHDMLKNKMREYFGSRGISFKEMTHLMTFPLAMVSANNICSLSSSVPESDRARYIMELLSCHQQLVERVVNDMFLAMKNGEVQFDGKEQNH